MSELSILGTLGGVTAGLGAWLIVRRGRFRREGDQSRLSLALAWVLIPVGAAIGLALGLVSTSVWLLSLALVFLVGGLTVSWTDLDVYRVPTGLVRLAMPVLCVVWAVACWSSGHWLEMLWAIAGAGIYTAGFYLIALVTTLGLGDVRLAAPSGFLLGARGLENLATGALWTIVAGGVVAVLLLVLRSHRRTDPTPLAPAVVAGALLGALL